jgi:hypothetical protein
VGQTNAHKLQTRRPSDHTKTNAVQERFIPFTTHTITSNDKSARQVKIHRCRHVHLLDGGPHFRSYVARSVSSLGFYGSMVVGMGETGEITQHTPYTGKEANGGIVKKHVGSSLGERAYSSCSFGGTTEFRYEGQGVPEQEQFWEHRISRVYSMWPESKRGKKVMKYGEKHLQRRESIQNSAGTHDISAHSAFREEANDQGGKSPDSVESPLPVPGKNAI